MVMYSQRRPVLTFPPKIVGGWFTYSHLTQPAGFMKLEGCKIIDGTICNEFYILGEKRLVLTAADENDKRRWIASLSSALNRLREERSRRTAANSSSRDLCGKAIYRASQSLIKAGNHVQNIHRQSNISSPFSSSRQSSSPESLSTNRNSVNLWDCTPPKIKCKNQIQAIDPIACMELHASPITPRGHSSLPPPQSASLESSSHLPSKRRSLGRTPSPPSSSPLHSFVG